MSRGSAQARRPGPILAVCLGRGAGRVLVWPMLTRSGYLLGHDMVFTPRQPLRPGDIGAGSAPPRAVPVDALRRAGRPPGRTARSGRIAVVAAGAGRAALGSPRSSGRLRLPGSRRPRLAVWNPYVVERLAHRAVGAAVGLRRAAVAVVACCAAARRDRPGSAAAVRLAAASITPTGGLIGRGHGGGAGWHVAQPGAAVGPAVLWPWRCSCRGSLPATGCRRRPRPATRRRWPRSPLGRRRRAERC